MLHAGRCDEKTVHHISVKEGFSMRRSIAVMVAAAFVSMSSPAVADDLGLGNMSEGSSRT